MNQRVLQLMKKISYASISNAASLLVSASVVLIVPKVIGVEAYGYWQLYLFYSAYVGFLHFGWNDGIYLRYGGKQYATLDRDLFFSQFWLLALFQTVTAVVLFGISVQFFSDADRRFVINMTAICLVVVNVRGMLLYIMQATGRILEYARVTILGRFLYFGLLVGLVALSVQRYRPMVIADIIGKTISLLYAGYCCKDMVWRRPSAFRWNFAEVFANIRVGMKLCFANIANLLIVGTVRLGIERVWSVSVFGKVSLTLSISNFFMVFVNALGIVLFPVLRRTNEKNRKRIYSAINILLLPVLLGALALYFPLQVILLNWLPKYADSVTYMALLFPICVFEGKMALQVNTYLKVLRREKYMMKINLITLCLAVLLTVGSTLLLKNIPCAVLSIVFLLAFRCISAELFLGRVMHVSVWKGILCEGFMAVTFLCIVNLLGTGMGIVVYGLCYGIYFGISAKDVKMAIRILKDYTADEETVNL